jgi:transposase
LLEWASSFGIIDRIGIEGTGSYGAGLSRWLRSQGLVVVEVDRADRADRRKRGKDDLIDAENAARAGLAERATGTPKSADGNVEMFRVLRVARRSAMRAKMVAINQLHALIVSAPDELRDQFAGLTPLKRARKAAALRPGGGCATVTAATKLARRTIARRYLALKAEIEDLDSELARLVKRTAPRLLEQPGIGVQSAAQLLVTAGDNPERLRSESSFAHLCGAAPLPASSGKTERHRLNRGGDRDANCALHMIAINRLSRCPRTRAYVQRRSPDGKADLDLLRRLKRYIAREVYELLVVTFEQEEPVLEAA